MTKTKRNIFEGVVETCAHRVSFWFDLEEIELTPELEEWLTEHAEERAKQCIIEGYVSGELNYYHSDTDSELRGWWDIIRN